MRSRPAGTLDRPNCLVNRAHTMIIHGTHTMGMGISGGGQPAEWGTWTWQWVHASPDSSWAGWQHIQRAMYMSVVWSAGTVH